MKLSTLKLQLSMVAQFALLSITNGIFDYPGEGLVEAIDYFIALVVVLGTSLSDKKQYTLWTSRKERQALVSKSQLADIHRAIDAAIAEKGNWPEEHPNQALLDGQLEALRSLIKHRELSKDEERLGGTLQLTNEVINREIR